MRHVGIDLCGDPACANELCVLACRFRKAAGEFNFPPIVHSAHQRREQWRVPGSASLDVTSAHKLNQR